MHNPEHRVQTTKKLLREALMTLLAEKPLRSITVKELCLRAKLNRGTFYAHYADVYDLLEQIEAEVAAEYTTALAPILSGSNLLAPPITTKLIFECIEANADLCRVIIGPYGDKEFARDLIRKNKAAVVESCKHFFPNADDWQINAYFTFITGGCFALMERWIRDGMVESSAVLADAAQQIMESGIAFLRRKA